ncbi:relaxase domain-containing protein [Pseudonocardia sp. EV170527-09]|uniref:MobF family relaxase n=1 Tax=Pseudonocardia sp. EV170527-09 TaxID=2603411 RepID=UPI0011F3E4CE|nr:MobF family relaxase [Pseudonocardia sp. EV170527-09]KAA1013926.1 relaxase domain-containing protein [Pseudonocardia sp. EV170527-09]
MLRITTVGAGAVEYLLRGSGCAAHRGSERAEGSRVTQATTTTVGVGGPGYYASAVSHGEPAGRWFGAGLGALGLPFAAGEVATAGDVRAVFGQLRRPESSEKDPVFIGSRPRNYASVEQRVERALAREKGAVSAERAEEIRRAAESDGRRSVAYYDWTFSAPKSVSVYYAALIASGAESEAEKVRAAHERAVEVAVSFADARVAVTRTGRHSGPRSAAGQGVFEQGRGTAWTLWAHSTNREDEPHLHTHAALLNRTATADGRVTALDGVSFRGIKLGVDAVYQQSLEQLVTAAAGVAWCERVDGCAREIAGVDESLMVAASTRRGQVVDRVEELSRLYRARTGRDPDGVVRRRIAQAAVLDTRAPKSAAAGPRAVRAWARAHVAQLSGALSDAAEAAVRAPAARAGQSGPVERGQMLAAAVARVSARSAVWDIGNLALAIKAEVADRWEVVGLAEASPAQRAAGLEALAREAVAGAGVVQVSMTEPVPVPDGLRRARGTRVDSSGRVVAGEGGYVLRGAHRERYSSAAHLGREEAVVARVSSGLDVGMAAEKTATVRAELAGQGLSADQVQAVLRVLTSRVAGDVLVGPAGAGKSRTMGALAGVWGREVGGRVLGLTTSQIAANNLADDHVEAFNTAVFTTRFTAGEQGPPRDRLRRGDLVIVDEAGMTSTTDLDLIMRLAAAAGAKVVLTGDPEQLGAVGAGGLFEYLVGSASSVTVLEQVHRFVEDWEKAASLRVRAGDTGAVAEYLARGRLHAGTVEEMETGASRAWLADTVAGQQSLLIVGTNEQAAQLSERLRGELIRLGRVGSQPVGVVAGREPGGQPVSVGDRVQARLNDRTLHVEPGVLGGPAGAVTNREVYTIVGAGQDVEGGRVLWGRDRHGATAHFPASYAAEYLRLAYAGTVHAAQSLTVDTGHAILGENTGRESAYPAMTRGRVANHAWLVASRDPDAHDQQALVETARSRFSSVIDHSGAPVAALTARAEGRAQARSLVTLAGDWIDLARARDRGRADQMVERALGPAAAVRVASEPGRGSLLSVLAEAEIGGHDPQRLLVEVAGWRELASAENVSDVLRWRIAHALPRRVPDDPVAAAGLFDTWTVPGGDLYAVQRNQLAPLIVDRIREFGHQAADQQPAWAVAALGPVPDPDHAAAEYADWVRRAGAAAGYREYTGIAAEAVSLGPVPPVDDVHARAWWTHAATALGVDTRDEYRRAPDAVLVGKVRYWDRVHAGAPTYAADQLADAHGRLHEARVNAILTDAAADNPRTDPVARELAAVNARTAATLVEIAQQQVEVWTAAHERRSSWWNHVSDLAEDARLATDELHRRGHTAGTRTEAVAASPEAPEAVVPRPDTAIHEHAALAAARDTIRAIRSSTVAALEPHQLHDHQDLDHGIDHGIDIDVPGLEY